MLIFVTLATLLVATKGDTTTDAGEEKDCGPGWVFLHRGCYRFSAEALSWEDAQLSCQTDAGNLMSVSDMTEKNKMRSEIKKLDKQALWWIGLKHKSGNQWEWLDKGPFSTKVTPWEFSTPFVRGVKDCVVFSSKAKIDDVDCNERKPFICERHEITPRPVDYTTLPITTSSTTQPATSPPTPAPTTPSTTTTSTTTTSSTTITSAVTPRPVDYTTVPITTSSTTQPATSPPTPAPTTPSTTTTSTTTTSSTTITSASTTITTTAPEHTTTKPEPSTVATPTTSSTENLNVDINEQSQSRLATSFRTPASPATALDQPESTSARTTSVRSTGDEDPEDEDESGKGKGNSGGGQSNGQAGSLPDDEAGSPDDVGGSDNERDSPDDQGNNGQNQNNNGNKKTTQVQTATEMRTTTTRRTTPQRPRTTTPRPTADDNKGGNNNNNNNKRDDEEEEEEEQEEEIDMFELYKGCYLTSTRQDIGKPFLYTLGSTTCPRVTASQITWSETGANRTRQQDCKNKNGFAFFHCGGNPVCWRGEPDIDACASPKFKHILQQAASTLEDEDTEPPEPEEAVALTQELANATVSDDITAEDVMVTSKVIKSLVKSGVGEKIKNKTEVQNIVANVVKAGSNLVATNKSRVWTEMTKQDKIRSATSLLVAMETATVAMAEEIDEPTVFVTKDENIELELRVLNVSEEATEDDEVVYNAEGSDNEFSIPVQTLSHLAKDKLAKVVFMTHYTMGDILDEGDDDADDETVDTDVPKTNGVDEEAEKKKKGSKPAPRLASYILSASVGGATEPVQLPEPVTFTMSHIRPVPQGYESLCSFWSISESGLGEWSQEGCRVVRSNANQTTCECDHMTNFAVLMAVQEVEISETHMSLLRLATIVGCVISCMCLLASWITFTCFTSLQGERNSIHKNLVFCLFVAEILFLAGIDQTQNRLACGLVAGFLHYFFLAAFLWMLLEGVHIVLMLVQVFDASRSRLPYYYAAGYAPPILIIAISAGLFYDGYGTDRYCWLTTERYFIWSFAGPVAIILLVNAVILSYAMTMVCRHSEYVFSGKEKNTAGGIRSWIQGALALEVLLGLTWILGYFFINTQTLPIAYLFTVLNSLQGLFIFCFHCLFNKKARKEYRRVMKVKRRPSSATSTGPGTQSASLKHKHDLSHDTTNTHQHHSNGHSNA